MAGYGLAASQAGAARNVAAPSRFSTQVVRSELLDI